MSRALDTHIAEFGDIIDLAGTAGRSVSAAAGAGIVPQTVARIERQAREVFT